MAQSTAYYFNIGNSASSVTIDWNDGEIQKIDMISNITTLNLSNPLSVGSIYVLQLIQDGTGGWNVTWPGSVKWGDAGAPTLSGANKTDLINLYWDGTFYLGSYATGY